MLAKNAMMKKSVKIFLGKTQNKICFINTKSKNRLIKEISIPDIFGTETSHRIKIANKPKEEKKILEIYPHPTFFGRNLSRNKKQTSEKKKRKEKEKTGTIKKKK